MYSLKHNGDNPYGEQIATFIKGEFPLYLQAKDASLIDLLSEAIVGTGQVRFGSRPSPETLVAIRQVISHWIGQNLPIPFLVAWGSEKPDGSNIDIAELFALKTLSCLNARVKTFYAPGVTINVRIEDASAPHLFFDRQAQARIDAALYTSSLVNLVSVVGMNDFIHPIPESTMTSEASFNAAADSVLPAMEAYLRDTNSAIAFEALTKLGWKGQISPDSINYYLERYKRTNAEMTQAQHIHMLARYYSGSLARGIVGSRGNSAAWGANFIELAFNAPIPGSDKSRVSKRVFYRTMPSSITSNHIAPWRAKGYLRINGDVSASLASFHSDLLFNPHELTLSNGALSQVVKSDYVIVDYIVGQ